MIRLRFATLTPCKKGFTMKRTFFCGAFFLMSTLLLSLSSTIVAHNRSVNYPLYTNPAAEGKNHSDTDTMSVQQLDSIVVTATGITKKTPVAHTTVGKEQLTGESGNHSIPMILALQPSVVATTEAGTGFSYSKLSVRGSDDSRVNITLDNIALNDPESQQVFWVNLPSLNASLQSIQIQRGLGTSMNGPAAFGGSINMQTISSAAQPYGRAEFSLGSYQSYQTIIGAGTGRTESGFSFDMRYAYGSSKGYIRNAKSGLHSLFATAGYFKGNNSVKLTYIYGDQCTGITWEGISPQQYKENRRYNPAGEYFDDAGNAQYYDNETDNYTMHHLHLTYIREFKLPFVWKTTFAFVKGDGFYENYKYRSAFEKYGLKPQVIDKVLYKKSDFIIRKQMDNSNYVVNSMLMYNSGRLKASAGVTANFYDGNHFGNVLWSKYNKNLSLKDYEWYRNNGNKKEFSLFARAEEDINEYVTLFADLQYRYIHYKMHGPDSDFVNLDYCKNHNFFNPKVGVNLSASQRSRFYVSVGMGHKEPTRGDLKDPVKAKSTNAIKAERMLDYELGYNYLSNRFSATANIYFMEYKDQLVASGKLSDVGYVIKQNIPNSYRRGIEFSVAYRAANWVRVDANATLSRNKAKNFTEYISVYDEDYNLIGQKEAFHKSSNLTLSPEVVGMMLLTFEPCKNSAFSISGKYVGEQYMDNSSDDMARVPGYFVSSFNASHTFELNASSARLNQRYNPSVKVSFTVDNLFNNKYYSYGWISKSYSRTGGSDIMTPYIGVYAQAPINFMARVSYNF